MEVPHMLERVREAGEILQVSLPSVAPLTGLKVDYKRRSAERTEVGPPSAEHEVKSAVSSRQKDLLWGRLEDLLDQVWWESHNVRSLVGFGPCLLQDFDGPPVPESYSGLLEHMQAALVDPFYLILGQQTQQASHGMSNEKDRIYVVLLAPLDH